MALLRNSVYATFSVRPLLSLSAKPGMDMNASSLLCFLSRHISMANWGSDVQTDSVEAAKHILQSHCIDYYASLLELAKLYIISLARLCKDCNISKTLQNTPNTDRL